MRFIDFFAGIGGFRLGMEMAGHECVGHCEIDEVYYKLASERIREYTAQIRMNIAVTKKHFGEE